jgi:hypothetical protein
MGGGKVQAAAENRMALPIAKPRQSDLAIAMDKLWVGLVFKNEGRCSEQTFADQSAFASQRPVSLYS